MMNKARTGVVIAAASAGLLMAAAVAYASIPSADGLIHGCYAKADSLLAGVPTCKGALRVVDAGGFVALAAWAPRTRLAW
jgi:hypothetical protein